MDIIAAVSAHAATSGSSVVHRWRDEELTFAELESGSTSLAAAIAAALPDDSTPVIVHGHKHPLMLVAFLACVKSGHPYVPVDSSTPASRLRAIMESSGARLLLAVDPVEMPGIEVWGRERLAAAEPGEVDLEAVGDDDPYYVIYTSGSTGRPKGVQISRASVAAFVDWALTLIGPAPDGGHVLLNQAPFSFDLSVYELMMSQASGAKMVSIDRDHIARFKDLYDEVGRSGATVWVSTPSFADLCLASKAFDATLLPRLRTFLFCGEALSNETARELRRRFPDASVINTYGPTESTVAVTSVVCDDDLLDACPVLPVGTPKPGTTIQIRRPDDTLADEGETGEIVIAGDTVSLGYLGQPELTAEQFTVVDGQRAYRTGDAGFLRDGMLHFAGRIDFQVKLHGYRIEIEDIETNLRSLPDVQHAVVLPVTKEDGGPISHLHAFVQLPEVPESPLRATVALRKQLKGLLPDYMIPKSFSYVEAIPLTANGKADRTALRAAL